MNFFKKIFKTQPPQKTDKKPERIQEELAFDDLFVEKFIAKGGRFLYCQTEEEVNTNLINILEQEQWQKPLIFSKKLKKLAKNLNLTEGSYTENSDFFFTKCEHLISEDGSILFSSKQLKEYRLNSFPQNFIVFAKTSQLVHNKGESLTGIKNRYQKKGIPSNIAAVKCYEPLKKSDDFMSYGNNNSKQLYLLLLEDL
ncbi:MAG: LUD domain-containing protein [Flavobacteriaceae bacterium]|nr:LUD domain-containing protein [Flavobacteriaceae bacterium]